MKSLVAEIVRKARLMPDELFERANDISTRDSIPFLFYILQNSMVDEAELMRVLAQELKAEVVDLDRMELDNGVLSCVPRDIALQYRLVPILRSSNHLLCAVGDPTRIEVFDMLSTKIGMHVKVKLASERAIQRALDRYYLHRVDEVRPARVTTSQQATQNTESSAFVVNYVDNLLTTAVQRRVSDIHIEPFESAIRVRLRLDGALIEYEQRPRLETRDALISRIKILAALDIAEKRLPQDGASKLEVPGFGKVDIRVNTMPTVWGESVVIRILDKSNLRLDMTKLGFEPEQLKIFKDIIHRPFGMVLVTGPTGSGKTTTLYSALSDLNRLSDCILTVEDPVEYTIPGIRQVQVKPEIDLTFAVALRAFLRQDPDVMMVGEIRDHETAEIATHAALTGHVVLSTLHTNTSTESVERLRNLGINNFALVSSLNGIVAQRLVRTICPNCKEPANAPAEELIALGMPAQYASQVQTFRGRGCEFCHQTGYRGRLALFELFTMSEPVRASIAKGQSELEIRRTAVECGMQTLRQNAWKKVLQGVTTIEELIDATVGDA